MAFGIPVIGGPRILCRQRARLSDLPADNQSQLDHRAEKMVNSVKAVELGARRTVGILLRFVAVHCSLVM